MKKTRRKFSASFKTKIVLEALKERYTLSELAQKHDLHPNQIAAWKREFLAQAESVFDQPDKRSREEEKVQEELYKQIGKMKVEIDWLKKNYLDFIT